MDSLELYELRENALFYVQEKNKELKKNYPDFEIIENLEYDWWLEYYEDHKTPFIDILYYPFLFKETSVYIDIEQYTQALNQVLRTFILRIKEDETFSEDFSKKIYENELLNPEFQIFIDKIQSLKKDKTLKELYQDIIFNESINYINKEDILELFQELSKIDLMIDLHNKKYFKLNLDITLEEFKSFQFDEGGISFQDNPAGPKKVQQFYLKNYRKIQGIIAKFNIIPIKGSPLKMNINKIFFYVDKVIFLPQFLVLFKG